MINTEYSNNDLHFYQFNHQIVNKRNILYVSNFLQDHLTSDTFIVTNLVNGDVVIKVDIAPALSFPRKPNVIYQESISIAKNRYSTSEWATAILNKFSKKLEQAWRMQHDCVSDPSLVFNLINNLHYPLFSPENYIDWLAKMLPSFTTKVNDKICYPYVAQANNYIFKAIIANMNQYQHLSSDTINEIIGLCYYMCYYNSAEQRKYYNFIQVITTQIISWLNQPNFVKYHKHIIDYSTLILLTKLYHISSFSLPINAMVATCPSILTDFPNIDFIVCDKSDIMMFIEELSAYNINTGVLPTAIATNNYQIAGKKYQYKIINGIKSKAGRLHLAHENLSHKLVFAK